MKGGCASLRPSFHPRSALVITAIESAEECPGERILLEAE